MSDGPGRFHASASTIQGLVQGDHNTVALTYNVYGSVAGLPGTPALAPQPLPTPVHLYPPAFAGLLDRRDELEAMLGALDQGLPVELSGPAGIGKSSLIRVAARNPRTANRRDGVVFWEYRKEPVDDFVQLLFDCFYETPGTVKLSEARLRQYLGRIEAVVLVDDADLDSRALETLRNAASGCTFVLASTEPRLWGEGRVIQLNGLPPDDAVTFLERQLGRTLDGDDLEAARRVCEVLDFHPLHIKQAHGVLKTTGWPLPQLAAELTTLVPITRRLVETLTPASLDVLAAAASLDGAPIPADHADSLTGQEGAAEELRQLETWGLARAHSPRYSVDPDVAQAVSARPPDRLVMWALERGGRGLRDDERELLLAAVHTAARRQEWDATVRLARTLDPDLLTAGRWDAWEDVLRTTLTAARQAGDESGEGWALHQLGTRALALERYDESRDLLEGALRVRRAAGELEAAQVTRQNLAILETLLAPALSPSVREQPVSTRRARRRWWPGALGVAAVLGLAGVVVPVAGDRDDSPVTTTSTATTSPSTTPLPVLTATALDTPRVARGSRAQTRTLRGAAFSPGATVVATPDTGITVIVTAQRVDALVLAVTATANASLGPRDLVVTTAGRTATCSRCLVVTAQPTVRSVSPARLIAGSGAEVTVAGTAFASDATVTFSGTGISATQPTPATPTEIPVTVSIAAGAATGPRDVTIDNHDGGSVTCRACFNVLSRPPS